MPDIHHSLPSAQGLALSTFQVVLVPTIVGVAANELFPKVRQPDLPLVNVPVTQLGP